MSARNVPALDGVVASVWSGRKLVVFGRASQPQPTESGGIYDPAADTWTTLSVEGAPPSALHQLTAYPSTSGRLVVLYEDTSNLPALAILDPESNRWTPGPKDGGPIHSVLVSAWTGDRLITWGGEEMLPGQGCPQGVSPCDPVPQFNFFSSGAIFRAP